MEFSKEELEETKYPKMHRLVIEKLRSSLPKDSSLMLYPFSLKKGENYYGIIFGAKHLRAVDKFLNLSWKINSINGEANFDIDDEMQLKLYESTISKIDKFKLELRNWILEKNTITNIDILKFTYLKGHIPKHAVEEVKLMKNEKLITFDGSSPKITYDNYKLNNILNITKL